MQKIIGNTALLVALCTCCIFASGQELARQVRNIQAFGKIAGYVQFFSASDVSQSVIGDWDSIYINGVQTVKNCKDDQELLDSLRQIFEPLEPAMEFTFRGERQNNVIERNLMQGPMKVFKQNIGLELYSGKTNAFKSIRVNRRSAISDYNTIEGTLLDSAIADLTNVNFRSSIDLNLPMDMEVFEDDRIILKRLLNKSDSLIKIPLQNVRSGRVQVKLKVDADKRIDISNSSIQGVPTRYTNRLEKDSTNKVHKYTVVLRGFDSPLYEDSLDISDSLHTAITDEISISFPLCLYGDSSNTYPISNLSSYRYNKAANRDYFRDTGILYNEVQVANLLMIWNVFRFSFAYLNLNEKEQQNLLEDVLRKSLSGNDLEAYVNNVWYMLRTYGDSHIFFDLAYIREKTAYSIPVDLQLIKNKLYVKDVFNDSITALINIGDEVLYIDNKPVSQVLHDNLLRTTGSDHNRKRVAIDRLLDGPQGSRLSLRLKPVGNRKSKEILVRRNEKAIWNLPGNSGYLKLNNGYLDSNLYYFDLTRNPFDENLLNKVAKNCPNIIIDMRGYLVEPNYNKMVRNLLKDSVKVQRIWVPNIISPTQTKWKSGGEEHYPTGGSLSKANIFFFADASTQSAPETLLELMKYKKVGHILGENTSGANGTINYLSLPGNMLVTFSGHIFKNSDGTRHHKIGIIPDYRIEYTLKNIINREDPYIIKVKELLKRQLK
ncbi:hypothetical protein FAZ19_00190 [Sphingobacterium alkalisoli]|uniref:Tail specific protease domain-containing protein n=1 Tax=Sphingobacterium alkalisoli TaxID=1874115 RepID=A0A4U0H7G6_9SPHI|nr:S41 family peptidase [Sphingobacterium alkalisoli]TJY67720.1 hypothetical protein FAZ19_00190 [Sphingobacterium alkalisoli]GGH11798.1 hypothetical protein GCM10011418_10890 [Sphingobacterium alkalisoli]